MELVTTKGLFGVIFRENNLMPNRIRVLLSLCLSASAVAAGQMAAHDLKITTRHSYSGSAYTTTTY
jgi:hypothetical protein